MSNKVQKAIKIFGVMIRDYIRLKYSQVKWYLRNTHNKTRMGNYFPSELVSVGKWTYGKLIVHHFECEGEGMQIGNYCSIGPDVEFFLGGEHHPKYVSNYPFALYLPKCEQYAKEDRTTKGKIVVDDDVWIGARTIILSGVHIGQGAIIGAGSVVAKDVPPYAIFGNGKVIKYRFEQDVIDELIKIDYSKIETEDIQEHLQDFYTADVKNAVNATWIPKK